MGRDGAAGIGSRDRWVWLIITGSPNLRPLIGIGSCQSARGRNQRAAKQGAKNVGHSSRPGGDPEIALVAGDVSGEAIGVTNDAEVEACAAWEWTADSGPLENGAAATADFTDRGIQLAVQYGELPDVIVPGHTGFTDESVSGGVKRKNVDG